MSEWFKRIAITEHRAQPSQSRSGRNEARRIARRSDGAGRLAGPLLASKHALPATAVAAWADARRGVATVAGDDLEPLLAHRLTALHLPHFLSEHNGLARRGGAAHFDHRNYLLQLAASEVAARDRRRVARLIRVAGFPVMDAADVNDPTTHLAQALTDCGYIGRGENVIAFGGRGAGKTRLAIGLGFAACQRGQPVRYTTAAALADELNTACDERRLLRLYQQLDAVRLLIVDDLGPAALPPSAASLLFEVFSRRAECRSTIVASGLPPEEWHRIFGSTRLADAVVERLARRAHRLDLGDGLAPWLPGRPNDDPLWREPHDQAIGAARQATRGPESGQERVLFG
jgi:DNA replication protein DnaC